MARNKEITEKPSERLEKIGIESICQQIAGGMSLRAWAANNGFCQQTVINWIDADYGRAGHYARARESREEAKFESLEDIGDQAVKAESAVEVQGLRLKSDNIKWMLARMNSKKYGDKVQTELTGVDGGPVEHKVTHGMDSDAESLLSKIRGTS